MRMHARQVPPEVARLLEAEADHIEVCWNPDSQTPYPAYEITAQRDNRPMVVNVPPVVEWR